jgi:hypothetical protein
MSILQRARLDGWLPAVLLFAGSVVFLAAGRHHPIINSTIGPLGTDQFYRAFAAHMLRMPNWESIHLGILLGPVLWAVGLAGIARRVSADVLPIADIGKAAMLLGASLWATAFVLDGYVGPRLAQAITEAGAGADVTAIKTFSTNQYMMARLGMLSMVLMGGSILVFSTALVVDARPRSWRMLVAGLGLLVGGWPLVAAARGEFWPGPFTSPYWTVTAISLGVWFLLLGTAVPGAMQIADESRTAPHERSPHLPS